MYLLRRIGSKQETGRSVRDRWLLDLCNQRLSPLKLNPVHGEVYSIQHYVIKFVSDLRQVGGFLQVLRFPPSINPTATI